VRATLHVNFCFTEVHAKKGFLDLLSTVLRKLPWEDAAPFLWLRVIETVAEGSEVIEAIAGCDDTVWQWRLARVGACRTVRRMRCGRHD
jgi:hypothetical protein